MVEGPRCLSPTLVAPSKGLCYSEAFCGLDLDMCDHHAVWSSTIQDDVRVVVLMGCCSCNGSCPSLTKSLLPEPAHLVLDDVCGWYLLAQKRHSLDN